jgi:NTP pyrophosphatase (non-canonical NTP hydrolase)
VAIALKSASKILHEWTGQNPDTCETVAAMIIGKREVEVAGIAFSVDRCHAASVDAGWWADLKTGEPIERNKGELLMLIVSEISEAMEAERKNLMDDKLPHRRGAEVELADAIIRIFDYCGAHGYDLAGAYAERLEYNRTRADHKPENRAKDGGKAF